MTSERNEHTNTALYNSQNPSKKVSTTSLQKKFITLISQKSYIFSFESLFLSCIKCKYEHFNGYNIWKGKAKMESTLLVPTKLTFSKNLRCLNLALTQAQKSVTRHFWWLKKLCIFFILALSKIFWLFLEFFC